MDANFVQRQSTMRIRVIFILFVLIIVSISCKKFLDAKPDQSITVPSTLQDLQAMLDADNVLIYNWPSELERSADDYYVTYADWAVMSRPGEKESYLWDANNTINNSWNLTYQTILYANTVLDNVKKIPITASNEKDWKSIKGAALFFRGFGFYYMAQVFSKPYNPASASTDLGIVLRLNSGIDEISVRSSLQKTYDQLIVDLKEAASLLPVTSPYSTRPNKPAAFGALARIYLSMRDYNNAWLYADSCLQLYNKLLDYNSPTLNLNSTAPFPKLNDELLFTSSLSSSIILSSLYAKVDSSLYGLYSNNDLRKSAFFKSNSNGSYFFKGSYFFTTNSISENNFNGIATNEIFLIRAECSARGGNRDSAMADLNRLLKKRFVPPFTQVSATTANDALNKILIERRKELCFRGLRWIDLRRFNLDGGNISLTRILNGQTYTLPSNDLRWVMLIPQNIIDQTGMPQNPR